MKQALRFAAIVVAGLTIHAQLAAQEQTQSKKQPIRYTVIDLGLAADQTAGIADNDSLDYTAALPDGTVHAIFRRHGKKSDLGTLGGPNSSALYGPSDRGQVVGKAETSAKDPNGEDFCFYGTNLICLAFVWQNGQMTALPILEGNNATASDINNRGEIVGYAETNTPDPTCPPPQVLQSPPVIWRNGEIHELPTVSGDPDGGAFAINDKGQAAGASGNCTTPFHALLWEEDGHVKDLGNLGGTVNVAQGINNRGHVTGASNLTGDTTGHAFLWTEEKGMQDLGTLEGDSSSYAFSVNDKDQVVGISADVNGDLHAFVWQDGVMTDLNKVIQHGFKLGLIEAFDINNRGEIVGLAALDLNDEDHAFLAIPCDEEHASWKGCEDEDAAAVQRDISERPNVTLSEHARTLLWQHLGLRYRIPIPQGVATQTAAVATTSATLQISPTSLNFWFVPIHTRSAAERVNLLDVGTTTLLFSGITISGTNASDFAQTHDCKASLPAGASCKVRVTVRPLGTGSRSAALTITDNAGGSPQKVPLTCVGCIPPGGPCYGPGPNRCCPAPRGHHSFCSNPTGWGTCTED